MSVIAPEPRAAAGIEKDPAASELAGPTARPALDPDTPPAIEVEGVRRVYKAKSGPVVALA